MSIPEKILAATTAMDAAADAINAATARKRPAAKEADAALKFDNRTNAETNTFISAPLKAHMDRSDLPHSETPEQLNTYSKDSVDSKLSLMPRYDNIPITQWGDGTFLDPGVTAFFEGASHNTDAQFTPLQMEDDGTLVYLRNGTNGSRIGVFYMYSPGALNGKLVTPRRTNQRYQPSFFPAGTTAARVYHSTGGVLAGQLQNASGVLGDAFLAFTNDTFDATNHQGCFISAADAAPMFRDMHCEVFMGTTDCFIIGEVTRGSFADKFQFKIWRVRKADLVSGGYVVPELLTGWTTQSYYGQRTSPDTIVLADCERSQSAAAGPIVQSPAIGDGVTNILIWHEGIALTDSAQDPVSGNIRTRAVNHIYSATQGGRVGREAISLSFIWHPDNRTASVDAGATLPILLTLEPTTIKITGSAVVNGISQDILPGSNGGFWPTCYYHPSRKWYGFSTYGLPDLTNHANSAPVITPGVGGKYNDLHHSVRIQVTPLTYSDPLFGSAVGGTIMGGTEIPGNKVLLSCRGRDINGLTQEGLVLAQRGANGYTYLSQHNGSYTGFAPHVDREFVRDMGLLDRNCSSLVSEIYANGTVKLSSGLFHEIWRESGSTSIDANLAGTGNVSFPFVNMPALKTAILNAAGNPVAYRTSALTTVVPQNMQLPPMAFLILLGMDGKLFLLAAELAITSGSRTGVINAFSVVSVSPLKQTYEFSYDVNDILQDLMFRTGGGFTIYEGADGWLCGLVGKDYVHYIGSYGSWDMKVAIPKSTNRPDWTTLVTNRSNVTYSSDHYAGVAGIGFGRNLISTSPSDDYTKLVFENMANNLSEFNAWVPKGRTVLASQDVAQGWLLHFTQEASSILNGKYSVIPAGSIDLSTIVPDPSNKTFYIYLIYTPGTGVSYQILTSQFLENRSRMYLGKLTTGQNSIDSISVSKVSKLAGFRLSAVSSGAAIPVTTGNPANVGHLPWQ